MGDMNKINGANVSCEVWLSPLFLLRYLKTPCKIGPLLKIKFFEAKCAPFIIVPLPLTHHSV